jgi:hypothetical protein
MRIEALAALITSIASLLIAIAAVYITFKNNGKIRRWMKENGSQK